MNAPSPFAWFLLTSRLPEKKFGHAALEFQYRPKIA